MDQLYHDARLVAVYDALNAVRPDFDFYQQRLPAPPSAILDIGCGTGVFARALAARGHRVVGVDPAAPMIKAARLQDASSDVNWIIGTVGDVPTGDRFDAAVMTGHAFQCLQADDDILNLFAGVAARLTPEGVFWFETRNAAVQPWLAWAPDRPVPPVQMPNGAAVQVTRQVLSTQPRFVTFQEDYTFDDGTPPMMSVSTLRFLDLPAIKTLAAKAGLRLSAVFGDWSAALFTADSPEIIVQLTAR